MSKRNEARQRQRQEQMRTRLIIVGALALVAVIITGVVILQYNQSQERLDEVTSQLVYVDVPVPADADGKAIGPADARVTIYEYADFFCPACAEFEATVGKRIKSELLPLGSVRLEFVTHQIIQGSTTPAVAAECALEQGLFWPLHDLIYPNQGLLRTANEPSVFANLAGRIPGMDIAAFESCQGRNALRTQVLDGANALRNVGINATPTLVVVIGSDGGLLSGNQSITGDNPNNPNVLVVIEDGEIVTGLRPGTYEEYFDVISAAVRQGLGLPEDGS